MIPGAWVAGGTLLSLAALITLMAWQGLKIDPWAKSTILFSVIGIIAAADRATRCVMRRPRAAASPAISPNISACSP